jgi:hypothetical protein
MLLYHSISNLKSLKALTNLTHSDNRGVLFSAYRLKNNPELRRELVHLPRYFSSIMLDCGSMQAIKRGEYEYTDDYKYILRLLKRYPFTHICQMDIPCYPQFTKRLSLNYSQILHFNITKGLELLEMDVRPKTVIILQGRNQDDYRDMVEIYERMGIFSIYERKLVIGLGGLAYRRDKGYIIEVARIIRDLIPMKFDLHIFGIGSPDLLFELSRIGFTSTDTSTPSRITAMVLRLNKNYTRTTLDGVKIDAIGLNSYNMAMWESLCNF